jgi:lipid-binding SYLF domain-containing protein
LRLILLALAASFGTQAALAAWTPDPEVPLQVAAARTIADARAGHPGLQPFFDAACAVAVFPAVRRVGLGAGFAWGQGVLITGDSMTARISQAAVTLGLQVGGQTEGQLIFFRNCEAADFLATQGNLGRIPGRVELTGRASAAALTAGGSADAGFSSDVAIFSLLRSGLMLELTAAGVRYRVFPKAGKPEADKPKADRKE